MKSKLGSIHILLLFAILASLCPAASVQASKLLLLPFAVNAPEGHQYLERQIPALLADKLRDKGAQVIWSAGQAPLSPAVQDVINSLVALAKEQGAQAAAWGSITIIGQSFSLDVHLIKIKTNVAGETLNFYSEGRNLARLSTAVAEIANQIADVLLAQLRVAQVKITGNKLIESDAILRVIETKTGNVYSSASLANDLRAIFAMGYFDDIEASVDNSPKGKIVTFKVKEEPTIRKIKIKGEQFIKEDKIRENLTLSTGTILNIAKVKKNVQQIEALYREKNYHRARVSYKLEPLDNNQVDLTFIIEEGPKLLIKKIRFEGNTAFSDKELKDIIKTSEKGFFSWLTSSGDLNRDDLAEDVSRIAAFYHNHGYIDAKVGEPHVEYGDDWITITIKIKEGRRFKIGKVDVKGDLLEPRDTLLSQLKIARQAYYSREVIRSDVLMLTDKYADAGYAYVDVTPETRENRDRAIVDIVFNISKKQPVYFEEIIIEGNTKTRDKVIRRELRIHEQELYNGSKLKRSVRNLYRLDFFKDIKVDTIKGSADNLMKVKIGVTEKPTGTFTFGAGYSTVEEVFFTGSITQRNFMGRGQKLQFKGDFGSRTTRFTLSFTEPWLFDIPLMAGIDVYNQDKDYDEYDLSSRGGGLRFSYPVFDYTRLYWGYRYDLSEVTNVQDDASDQIKELNGVNATSAARISLKYDSRNRIFNPSEGSYHSIAVEYAGLGGDIGFTKYLAETGWYYPLFWKFTGFLHAKAGWVYENGDKLLPDYEKFYLGGINSVRGFDYRDIHLTEINSEGVETKIGGNQMFQMNLELIFPISEENGFMGVVFYDSGNVYGSGIELGDLRHSAGYGVRWFSPMGPIRLEAGHILDPREGESSSARWEFAIGGAF